MKLEVRKGCFGYNGQMILQDINFEVGDNTVMTILGPNGVGKTTLLKCIMGFLKWKSGKCLIDGKELNYHFMKEFWQRTSYVSQAKQNVFSYKVIDAVIMGLNAKQNFFAIPSAEDYEKAYQVLKTLRVEKLVDKHCNALSGGELQMVMMARALISEPELLILDEPESNLDMKNQLMIVDTIERAAREFKTSCLINTHFPNHALKISDKTLMLGYGKKQLQGRTMDIVTESNIKEFFGVCSKVIPLSAESEKYYTIFPYKIAE